MRRHPTFTLCIFQLSMLLLGYSAALAATPASDYVKQADIIFGTYSPPYDQNSLPPAIRAANKGVAMALKEFLAGMMPDPDGNDWPNPDEYPIDQITAKLGDSKFRFLLQGVGNLKVLNGPILYNTIQGGAGIEYDLVSEGTDYEHRTLVALRISPLYAEMGVIRMSSGGQLTPNLPTDLFVGSSFGLEIYKRMGIFQPGIRAYARPEVEVGGSGASGVSLYGSVYCLIHIKDIDWAPGPDGAKATLRLRPELSYFDRGAQQADLYAWGKDQGVPRTLEDIRHVYQGMLYLEIKY